MCKIFSFFVKVAYKNPFANVLSSVLMSLSLRIRPWDDILLVSVLRGQNVTGDRKDRGKKDVLVEQISVVLLRAELLQRQRRFTYLHIRSVSVFP